MFSPRKTKCFTLVLTALSPGAFAQSKSTPVPFDGTIDFLAEPTPLVAHTAVSTPAPIPPTSRSISSADAPNAVVKDYLKSLGVAFPEGSAVVYVAASGNLVVHNTPANLLKIDQLLQNGMKPLEEPENVRALRARLSVTTLPHVHFGNASVPQALDYLKRESARLSRLAGAEDRISIILRTTPQEDSNDPSRKSKLRPRINLHLRNVTLETAIQAVAEQAGLEYKIESNSVMLVPKETTSTNMLTRIYPFQFN